MKSVYISIAMLSALVGTIWLLLQGGGKSTLTVLFLLTYVPMAVVVLVEAVNKLFELRRKQADRARRTAIAEQFVDDMEAK